MFFSEQTLHLFRAKFVLLSVAELQTRGLFALWNLPAKRLSDSPTQAHVNAVWKA
ncbi:hypothetical protein BRCON_2271 [Candidatus Sumerlaea chitinivorans]|uniref:Uncharacterized protein n=1 Tax=Sumerlaea chitinivorans TaxID=2250252 RepID=A0A2Z4Y899_SUMC1|nr:hypothetical protein BRCON_2271 [Candidatus Sumerlaea chitinivorans]